MQPVRFITADVSLSREELERLYGDRYFHGEEYRDYVSEREIFAKQFELRLKRLLRYVPEARRKRLFEIGAAYGFFLELARQQFAEVEGIDLSREAAAYATDVLGIPVNAETSSTTRSKARSMSSACGTLSSTSPVLICTLRRQQHTCPPAAFSR